LMSMSNYLREGVNNSSSFSLNTDDYNVGLIMFVQSGSYLDFGLCTPIYLL